MDADPDHLSSIFLLFQQAGDLPAFLFAQLIVLLLLLLASALFSGSEVALFSLDTSARHALAQAGDRASSRVLALLEHPRQLRGGRHLTRIPVLRWTAVQLPPQILGQRWNLDTDLPRLDS